ncbi:MAG: DNA-binding protein [Prevotella sp.]|nr:DNA-binding protein [Prevotella sp.]MDD7030186.1 DNA-binding protein [Prevotellaceae bacterium]MDY5210678.1 DNA-binding protein [Prevotella sp.]
MALKIRAQEKKILVGPNKGQYAYVAQVELYSALSQNKVLEEAALSCGVNKSVLAAAWEGLGHVINRWATEGHSVPIPGLGTMRFSVNSQSVEKLEDVSAKMITTRKVVFTPSTDLKSTLASTSVSITCYDRNGDLVKRVTAAGTDVDSEGDTSGEDTENPTDTGGSGSTGSGSTGSGSDTSGSGSSGSGSDSGADSDGGGYYE